MQFKPFLTKLKLRFRNWGVKYGPRVKTASIEFFFHKHWAGAWPTADYLSTRTCPRFFFDFKEKARYVTALKNRLPQSVESIPMSANAICENRFDLLGSGPTRLGEVINWNRDFKSGFEWPRVHYTKIEIVNLSKNADVKVPWELSRLQFLTTLGRGYWVTNDSRYLEKFISILSNWIKYNPVDYGVNWTCSMEVAIRAINIIWGMYFFGNAGELPVTLLTQILHSLYYHALHIERNLEVISKGANSNHLLANYLGLFYIGLLFPEFDKSGKWFKMGKEGLEQEILLQVHTDGADYECSLSYHRLVSEIFLSAFILGKVNQIKFSQSYAYRITKMIEFSAAMTSHSGAAPAFGDNDDGYIVKLANDNPNDHRALIDVGVQILNVKIPENVELSEERLWYLGPESLQRWPATTRRKPRLFKESGLAVVQNDRMHLVFNANGISENGLGGHKHNDLLSLTLEIDSVPFLIDAGTACYTSDYQERNRSRSTGMHNTIRFDEEEQNRFIEKALFFMFRDARAKIDLWTVTDKVVILSGYHDGYARLGGSIIHRRTLEVAFIDKCINIWDEVTGADKKEHAIESNYLTPLECQKAGSNAGALITGPLAHSLHLNFKSNSELHVHTNPVEYFPRYGTVKTGTRISCRCRTPLPYRLETQLKYVETALAKSATHRVLTLQSTI